MPRLSIVIPWMGATEAFERTLVSVLQNRPADCEVVVVHAQPYDDPYAISDEVMLVEALSETTQAGLINRGLAAATGEVVHVLACGVEVQEGWTSAVLQQFDDPQLGSLAPLWLESHEGQRILGAGVVYGAGGERRVQAGPLRSHPTGGDRIVGPLLQAGFYRRAAVLELGGFDPLVGDALADVDLAVSLATIGYRSALDTSCRVYGFADFRPSIPHLAAGRQAERLFWRHAPAIGWLRAATWHPAVVVGNLLSSRPSWSGAVARLCGRALAILEVRAYRSFYRRLRQARRPTSGRSLLPLRPAPPTRSVGVACRSPRRAA